MREFCGGKAVDNTAASLCMVCVKAGALYTGLVATLRGMCARVVDFYQLRTQFVLGLSHSFFGYFVSVIFKVFPTIHYANKNKYKVNILFLLYIPKRSVSA